MCTNPRPIADDASAFPPAPVAPGSFNVSFHLSLLFRFCRYIADTEQVIGTSASPSDVLFVSADCGKVNRDIIQ
jgi:hypothetical protein